MSVVPSFQVGRQARVKARLDAPVVAPISGRELVESKARDWNEFYQSLQQTREQPVVRHMEVSSCSG